MKGAAVLVVALLVAAAGCGGDDGELAPPTLATTGAAPTQTEPAETETDDGEPEDVALRVYFVRDERVATSSRVVERQPAVARLAMRALLAGPTDAEREAGLTTAIPDGTELRDITIARDVATVDLSSEFESGGGSLSMQARVAQVVYTLTQFPTVESVAFRIDGRPVEAIGGEGVLVSPSVDRADFEDVTPQILVETPTPGETVASPLRVSGTANTFEATMFLRVVDASGNELVDQLVTATSGSGQRGTFDATLRFDVARAGAATLVAYERSAEDGSEIHVVRIPLELRR